jgi:hypothetical protein
LFLVFSFLLVRCLRFWLISWRPFSFDLNLYFKPNFFGNKITWAWTK